MATSDASETPGDLSELAPLPPYRSFLGADLPLLKLHVGPIMKMRYRKKQNTNTTCQHVSAMNMDGASPAAHFDQPKGRTGTMGSPRDVCCKSTLPQEKPREQDPL